MSNSNLLKITILIAYFFRISLAMTGYSIPSPELQILSPRGFRISIPDSNGIVLFAFHGAVNRPLKSVEPGDFSSEITRARNGKWVYENTKVTLEPGDVLYYWIHVQNGNQVYRLLEKSETIRSSTPVRSDDRQSPTQQSGNVHSGNSNTDRPTTNHNPRPSVQNPSSHQESCTLSKTTVRGRNVCQGQLIFEDDFEILNWTKWKREIRIPLDTDDADFVSFQSRPENCYITSGHLYIVPNLLTEVPGFNEEKMRMGYIDLGSECTGIVDVERECKRQAGIFRILPPVVSARIRTKEFFSFRYGKVEIRAKLPRGDWLFPQIFLEPFISAYGITGYASGQMRIAFIRGNEILDTKEGNQINGYRLSGGVVLTTGDAYRDTWLKSTQRREHLGRDFHVYTLVWTDEVITISIDGNDYSTIRGGFHRFSSTHNISHATQWENGEFMAPFDKEFYIALGVSAGGISDFPDGCRTGPLRQLKPWANTSPKAELKFWNDSDNWVRTWEAENAGMQVDYIKVWAL